MAISDEITGAPSPAEFARVKDEERETQRSCQGSSRALVSGLWPFGF